MSQFLNFRIILAAHVYSCPFWLAIDIQSITSIQTCMLLSISLSVYRIKYFPFDSQTCPLKFNSQNVPAEKVLLKAGVGILSGELSSSEWHAEAFNGTHRTFNEKNILSNRPLLPFSQVRFCLYLTRYSRYYVMLLIVPSTILNLMTLMTFFSPPDSGERISLSISMIVGLTVFQLLVADMLPATRGNDNPILGSYLTGNFILAVVAIPFSLFTANIIYNNPTKTSLTKKVLDAIMPVMYLLKLLKKPGKRIATVTSVDESVKRADSLTPVDVIDGEPIRRTGRKEERRGTENDLSGEQRQALFFKVCYFNEGFQTTHRVDIFLGILYLKICDQYCR